MTPQNRPIPGTKARRAFSLIELLVTIAVIAILIGLCVPVLRSARLVARQTVCLNNARTAATSVALYTNNAAGAFPFGGNTPRTVSVGESWVFEIGGTGGLWAGRWSTLFPDDWNGPHFSRAMWCPSQPAWNPAARQFPYDGPIEDGSLMLPLYSMSRAIWLDPDSLRDADTAQHAKVRANKIDDVTYPSNKALFFEQIGYCIDAPGAQWAIHQWSQTPLWPTSTAMADTSARRIAQKDGIPAAGSWPFDATTNGVRGRDVR